MKREIRNFHDVVVQKGQKKIQKKLRCTGKVFTLLSSRLKSLMFPAKQEEVMSFDEGVTFTGMLDGKANGCPQWFRSLHSVASSMEKPQLSRYTRPER